MATSFYSYKLPTDGARLKKTNDEEEEKEDEEDGE